MANTILAQAENASGICIFSREAGDSYQKPVVMVGNETLLEKLNGPVPSLLSRWLYISPGFALPRFRRTHKTHNMNNDQICS